MNTRVAEWLLALVLPADRAATTIGDFVEDAAARGGIWFWSSILRVFVSGLWTGLAHRPLDLTGLALRAWLVNTLAIFVLPAVLAFLIVLVLIPFLVFAPKAPQAAITGVLGSLLGTLLWPTSAWLTGRWLARRARNREVAACFAYCLIQFLVSNAVGAVMMIFWRSQIEEFVAAHQNYSSTPSSSWINFWTSNAIFTMILLACAIRTRRANLRAR